ncbi:MAG TPA: flagellar hook-length control protein FliK [Candidatus Baltobacteraceae bacterium]|nr:flagellar hook-length control protein FliK [Candidatus Baltobacteraceae bacterium]
MSSLDPLAAIVADAALAQSAVAAIDLGVQIEILQQQLSVGDLLTATILPPQNGTDLLSFLGQTVQAQLPPGIDPGETLLLQVSGFTGNQILVRNIGVVDPDNPPPTVTVTLPPPEPGAPVQATLVAVQTPAPAQPLQPSAPAPQTYATPLPVAPPRAVFVAASVQRAQGSSPQPPAPQTAPVAKNVPIVVPPATELGLEARIAATRAASVDIAELVSQPVPAKTPPAPVPQAPTPPAAPVPPPAIATRAAAPAPVAPELALLARLRIPALPFTIAAARLTTNAASILPKTLARLDTALNALGQGDARADTIRTIAAFVGKIDLGNVRALPEQLMAYVSNVVDGAESKLAALARTLEPPPAALPEEPEATAAGQTPAPLNAPVNAPANPAPQPMQQPANQQNDAATPPPAIAARAAERNVALQYDLKAAIVSMLDTPARGSTPQLAATLGEALTAITAVQLGAVNAQNTDPSAIVIPLPVFYYEGGRPAQLRISRDAPEGGKKLDADNFRIAFVLDTKSLGTVAVDVQTASRSVSVNVKTEVPAAAARFRGSFGDLRGRLEQLRYRVANIAANVAPSRASDTPSRHAEPVEPSKPSGLDLQA